jgi:RNA polymerase sigma-19 factor, ECF subfamily
MYDSNTYNINKANLEIAGINVQSIARAAHTNIDVKSLTIADIYIHHYRWLVNFLNRKLSCSHRAADLAQDTFVRVIAKQNTIAINALLMDEARSLLTTIAKGLLIDHYRHQAIENAYMDALAKMAESQVPSPEENALILETLQQINQMLEGLSVKSRRIFLLSQLDDMTYPEIAKQLNISLSSVQKHMTKTYAACYAVRYQT